MKRLIYVVLLILSLSSVSLCQRDGKFNIARLKYNGGSDWYNDPSEEVNLLKFVAQNTNIKTDPEYQFVDLSTGNIFAYPFLFMTGHGNIVFSDSDAKNFARILRTEAFFTSTTITDWIKLSDGKSKKFFPIKICRNFLSVTDCFTASMIFRKAPMMHSVRFAMT